MIANILFIHVFMTLFIIAPAIRHYEYDFLGLCLLLFSLVFRCTTSLFFETRIAVRRRWFARQPL